MPLDYLICALATLFVVVDPIGLVPTLLGVTEAMAVAQRRRVAMRAVLP